MKGWRGSALQNKKTHTTHKLKNSAAIVTKHKRPAVHRLVLYVSLWRCATREMQHTARPSTQTIYEYTAAAVQQYDSVRYTHALLLLLYVGSGLDFEWDILKAVRFAFDILSHQDTCLPSIWSPAFFVDMYHWRSKCAVSFHGLFVPQLSLSSRDPIRLGSWVLLSVVHKMGMMRRLHKKLLHKRLLQPSSS